MLLLFLKGNVYDSQNRPEAQEKIWQKSPRQAQLRLNDE